MTARNEGLTKTFNSGAAIARSRIVKFGADERTVIQAAGAASTEFMFGVADNIGSAAAADVQDVILDGIATVEYGATVVVGAMLTSDSTGRAVTAAPATGVNNRVIGIAVVAGVVGDLGAVLISTGTVQG